MTIKKKLTLGLGLLFLIIFVLVAAGSYEIGKLSADSANILKDNYDSIVYAHDMSTALDDMMTAAGSRVVNPAVPNQPEDFHANLFAAGRAVFEKKLKAENGNVTEVHEREYVDKLNADYDVFLSLGLRIMSGEGNAALFFGELQPAAVVLKRSIDNIHDVNMQAVERKSRVSKQDSARIIVAMAVLGFVCLALAFFYFSYFPSYVSNTLAYVSARTRDLLKKANIAFDIRTDDEAQVLRHAVDLLDDALTAEVGHANAGRKKRPAKAK